MMLKKEDSLLEDSVTLPVCGLPPTNPHLQLNYEKNLRQVSLEGQPTKYLSYLHNMFKTLRVFKYKDVQVSWKKKRKKLWESQERVDFGS